MDQDNQTNQNPAPIDINNLGMDEIRESSTQATQPEHRVYDINDIANADDSAYENVTSVNDVPAASAPAAPELERPELTREHLNALFATDLVEKSPNIATAPTEEPAPAASPVEQQPTQPAPSTEPQPAAAPVEEPASVDNTPLQVITAPPAKQVNVGLIIAIVVILLLIGGGVAAYFAFFAN